MCAHTISQLLNVVTISVESMHRLPEVWGPMPEAVGEDHEYVYKLKYSLPGAVEESSIEIEIQPGEIVAKDPEPEPPADGEEGDGSGDGGAVQESKGVEGAFEPEPGEEGGQEETSGSEAKDTGELVVEEDAYVQSTGSRVVVRDEKSTARITFNHTTAIAMQAGAIVRIKKLFAMRNALHIELIRELRAEGEEYVYSKKYHGKIFLDGTGLLEPGATSVDVRCAVEPAEDFALPTEKQLEDLPPPGGEPEPDNEGGANPYLLAETYLKVHIQTMRPLVNKPKPPPPQLPKVQDLLPTRAPVPKYAPPMSGSEQFSSDIEGIILELADEYHALFLANGGGDVALEASEVDSRRQQAIFQLNTSGRYYDFKERLKTSTLRIVRERFYKQGLDPTSEDGKRVISRLYLELQDLINLRLKSAFSAPKKPSSTANDSLMLQHLADEMRLAVEAQLNLDFPLASSHLNTRILAAPSDAVVWYDYGVLCVRNGQLDKAQECLRECLMLDPRYTPALLTYGVLLCTVDRFADAETYFTGATNYSPDDVQAWSLLMLFYDMESRDMQRRTAIKKILLLDKASSSGTRSSPYLRAAIFCTDLLGIQLVERAATQHIVKHGLFPFLCRIFT